MTIKTGRNFQALFAFSVLMAIPCAKAPAQDAGALWQQIAQAPFDLEKSASVENVVLERDRLRITLTAGTIQFGKPAQDLVYAAAFHGRGRVEVKPPTAIEVRQLRLFTGQDSLAMDFTEATFTFSDATFDEIARQVRWAPSSDRSFGELYLRRQNDREDAAAELVPRLFKAVLSADRKRSGLFVADLKTGDKGWIHLRADALAPEEVTVGRWTSWGPVDRFDSWLSFPAGERSAQQAYANPSALQDIVIHGYQIDTRLNLGAELNAVTSVDLTVKASGERALLFHLDGNLRVQSVKDKAGNALAFFQPRDPKDRDQSYGDYIVVVLPAHSSAGDTHNLEFSYGGKRVVQRVGVGSYFCQSFGWYPALPDSFISRSDFAMTFRCPKRFTVVATGNKTGERMDGDWMVTNWKSGIPIAVAGFAFGDFKVYTEKVGRITIEAYANPVADDSMRELLNAASRAPLGTLSPAGMIKTMGIEMGNTLRLFETYFGPYPYDRLAVTNIPFSYGQGWPMLIYLSAISFMDSTQRNALGITSQHIQLTDFFRSHESSHQWWGHRVGWKSYHDQWLSEGFAQFSGNLYVQYRQSEKAYLARLKQDKESILMRDQKNRVYESLGPVWMGTRLASADAPEAYARVVYDKGGLLVNALRRMLWNPQSKTPDDRFIAMMKDYCDTYNNRPASTEDFKAVLEKHLIPVMDLEKNGRMDWFFRQYVYGTGVPEYQIQWQTEDGGGGRCLVRGKVIQRGVPAGWLDVLVLYAEFSEKVSRLGLFSVNAPENPFELTLPARPDKMILNYLEDTLAVIR